MLMQHHCRLLRQSRRWLLYAHTAADSFYSGNLRRRRTLLCKSSHLHFAAASTADKGADTKGKTKAAYDAVIGIECHIQLSTSSKAFCRCKNEYGAPPNTHVCPVCLGHPGTLPVLNEEVLKRAVLAGLALDCQIAPNSNFDRKQYFYPDLPKGYQVTQSETPIAAKGEARSN